MCHIFYLVKPFSPPPNRANKAEKRLHGLQLGGPPIQLRVTARCAGGRAHSGEGFGVECDRPFVSRLATRPTERIALGPIVETRFHNLLAHGRCSRFRPRPFP